MINFDLMTSIGSGSGISWSLTNNIGSLQLKGKTYNVVAYAFQQWGPQLALVDLIGIAEDSSDLAIVYLYCNTNQSVYLVYTESFYLQMSSESASGSASYNANQPETVDGNLPGIKSMPPTRQNGITIRSSDNTIEYHAGQGWAVNRRSATNYSITTFNVVDCRQCGQGGWYELHSFFHEGLNGCFGILYLEFNSPNSVLLDWGMCFGNTPALYSDQWQASWSGNLLDRQQQIHPRVLPRFTKSHL